MRLAGALFVMALAVGMALLFNAPSPDSTGPTPTSATSKSNQALIAKQQAERQEQFVRDRPEIMAKAKKLASAKDYWGLVHIGDEYAFAHDAEFDKLVGTARDRVAAAAMAKVKAEGKTAQKKEGASIGMSADEVLASSWGRPDSVNRTTTAGGTREQWVYSRYKNGYLYFDNGVLTAVQN